MSDLQDLIATNAVRAYNEGFERGESSERERISKAWEVEMDCDCDNAFLHMKSRIEGEQK